MKEAGLDDMAPKGYHFGSAPSESLLDKGWLIGHFFKDEADVRSTRDVEVKWSNHAEGEQRDQWTAGETRTTLSLLITGQFEIALSTGVFILKNPGDYLLWDRGIEHSWRAIRDSTILTVRWPSVPGQRRSSAIKSVR
ncbi:hypothetical protein GCM10020218_104280 [Dactylosporangium vinaceum]